MPKAALRRKVIAVQKCKLFQHFMVNYRKRHKNSFLLIPPKKIKKQTKHYENPLVICWLHGLYPAIYKNHLYTLGVITIPVHCAVK